MKREHEASEGSMLFYAWFRVNEAPEYKMANTQGGGRGRREGKGHTLRWGVS